MAGRHVPLSARPEIARRRIMLGVEQRSFARMLGLSSHHYCQYETGVRPYPSRVTERAEIILTELEAGAHRAQRRIELATAGGRAA